MHVRDSYISCGVWQLYGLQLQDRHHAPDTIKAALARAFLDDEGPPKPGQVIIFSDADVIGNGLRVAEYITTEGLGTLSVHKSTNPNTGNAITTWLWTVGDKQIPGIDYNDYFDDDSEDEDY